jgi:hypothetical protein
MRPEPEKGTTARGMDPDFTLAGYQTRYVSMSSAARRIGRVQPPGPSPMAERRHLLPQRLERPRGVVIALRLVARPRTEPTGED